MIKQQNVDYITVVVCIISMSVYKIHTVRPSIRLTDLREPHVTPNFPEVIRCLYLWLYFHIYFCKMHMTF